MTFWGGVAFTCAAFLGAFIGAWLAQPHQQPRHPSQPSVRRFPLDEADLQHRGRADRPRHVKPDEGEL